MRVAGRDLIGRNVVSDRGTMIGKLMDIRGRRSCSASTPGLAGALL